jgi:hypothetical protein
MLHRDATLHGKTGAQYFMPPNDFLKAKAERIPVQPPFEFQSEGIVISRIAGIQLVNEP